MEENKKVHHELEEKILKIINTYFYVQYNNNNIETVRTVRRIGRKSEKARRVILSFTTIALKIKNPKNRQMFT